MNIVEKFGLLLTISSLLLAVYTGNIFGFSKNIQEEIKKLKSEKNYKSKDKLLYYKINEKIRRLWPITTIIGIAIFIIGNIL